LLRQPYAIVFAPVYPGSFALVGFWHSRPFMRKQGASIGSSTIPSLI